jgi:hypothetical protein
MEDRIDHLFQEWVQLGGAVLLAQVDETIQTRSPEQVIAESTAYCRDSGRLTWVMLGWLVCHVDQVDEKTLLQETIRMGDLAVLGVLCDAAYHRNAHPKFERIMRVCKAPAKVEPFFHRVARSPLALALTRENALDVFKRWNYLCNELRYL